MVLTKLLQYVNINSNIYDGEREKEICKKVSESFAFAESEITSAVFMRSGVKEGGNAFSLAALQQNRLLSARDKREWNSVLRLSWYLPWGFFVF